MKRLLLLTVAVALLLACGARWRRADPRLLHLGGPRLAYEATVATLQNEAYLIARNDPNRGLVVVLSKVDQKTYRRGSAALVEVDEDRASWIAFQAYRDGTLQISATGRLVKDDEGLMHRKLDDEIERLRRRIFTQANAMYEASLQPAAPAATAAPAR